MNNQFVIHNDLFQFLRESVPSASNSQIEKSIQILIEYFDTDFYLNVYEDVARSEMDPLQHYLIYGWKEHRKIRIKGHRSISRSVC